MTVKLSFFLNDEISHYCTISSSDAEFSFIKNSLVYISENLKKKNNANSIYHDYLSSIAISKDMLKSNNVTNKLDRWIKDIFVPQLDYKIDITIESNYETFSICM
jgi:hypothetical protein